MPKLTARTEFLRIDRSYEHSDAPPPWQHTISILGTRARLVIIELFVPLTGFAVKYLWGTAEKENPWNLIKMWLRRGKQCPKGDI